MRHSLGLILAFGLAGLQFLAVLAVVFLSFLTSERALLGHARELLSDVGINTIEHSRGFLSPARGAAQLAARLAENRIVASEDSAQLEQLLFQQLRIAPQSAGVYFGSEQGAFVYVMRSTGSGPYRTKIITVENGTRQTELIWRDEDFNVIVREDDPEDTFDPRSRPWYQRAATEIKTIWTDPYIFFSSQQPGITLAAPVLDEDGSVRGVIGVDIEISEISTFLSRLNIGNQGQALIIYANGDVIAHPDLDLIKTEQGDGTLRFAKIHEFGDPVARTAFGALARQGQIPVPEKTLSQFSYRGETFVSIVMPQISADLPWTIAAYAPENDFTAAIKRNRATNIWIAALIAAITGAVGLALANYIHKPVRAFAVRASLIAQGEIDPDAPRPKTYRELERANETLVQQIVARKETEWEYGQTFDLSSRGIAQIDPHDGAFIRANATICTITGRDSDEILQMRLVDLIHPDDVGLLQVTDGLLMQDFTNSPELRCLRKDGEVCWVTLNAILIRNQRGDPLHAVLTMDDITPIKEREAQLARLNKDISHLARGNTMSEMAAGLAHELNQPLTAIAQNVDAALVTVSQDASADPELREILTAIEQQAIRAGDIIRALRGFIRKDEGAHHAFDFAELLGQTRRLAHAEATEACVSIVQDIAPLPPVFGNRVQVAQVLINLMRNGIEAIAGHDAGPDAPRQITVAARRVGETVEVCVQDTGPGIDPDLALFSQFETSKPDGMGLGLSICRSLVAANGGRLWHDEDFEAGARFCFSLPLARPVEPGQGPAALNGAGQGGGHV